MATTGERQNEYAGHGIANGPQLVQLFYADATGNPLASGAIATPLAVDFSDSTNGLSDTVTDSSFLRLGKDLTYTIGAVDNPISGVAAASGGPGTTDASTKITAQVDGLYRVKGHLSMTGVTTEITELSIWVNGAIMASPPSSARAQVVANAVITTISIERILNLKAEDYVELRLGATNALATGTCYEALFQVERIA